MSVKIIDERLYIIQISIFIYVIKEPENLLKIGEYNKNNNNYKNNN